MKSEYQISSGSVQFAMLQLTYRPDRCVLCISFAEFLQNCTVLFRHHAYKPILYSLDIMQINPFIFFTEKYRGYSPVTAEVSPSASSEATFYTGNIIPGLDKVVISQ